MKRLNITTYGMITLLLMGFPVSAEPDGTEAELQALERELDKEQARLNQRRQELELRKLRLELRKDGQDVPKNKEMSDEDKAAELARLQANAEAVRLRGLWMDEWKQAKDLQEPEKKSERRMGSPRALGKRAQAKEEMEERAKKHAEMRIKALEKHILTSMQSSLSQNESLNKADLKWLEALVVIPEDEETPPLTDEATRRRAQLILDLVKEGKQRPERAGRGLPAPVKPTPAQPVPVKPVPILVE